MEREVLAYKRGYRVTEDGILINPDGKNIGHINNGYLITSIRINKVSKNLKAHRLQAFQKYGNDLYMKGIMTRHKNGDSLDNSWDNILIGNNSDNQMDIPKQVRIKRSLHATSFIRKYNKDEIKKFHSIDRSYKKTMNKFNISSKGTLYYVLNK